MIRLLRYLVEESIRNGHAALDQRLIASLALGLTDDFSPSRSAYVRVTVARLRRLIEHYYAGPGRGDPVVLEISPGPYRLIARTVDGVSDDEDVEAARERRRHRPNLILVEPDVKGNRAFIDGVSHGVCVRSASLLVEGQFVTVSGPLLRDRVAADGRSITAMARELGYDFTAEPLIRLTGTRWKVRLKITSMVTDTLVSDTTDDLGSLAPGAAAIEALAGQIFHRVADYFAALARG